MPSTKIHKPIWHPLYFHIDEEGDSVLTSWFQGSRYHVIANRDQFGENTTVARKYRKLAHAVEAGEEDSAEEKDATESDDGFDSGVDVRDGSRIGPDGEDESESVTSPEEKLKAWMMSPVTPLLPGPADDDHRTLQDWYHSPVVVFQLEASDDGEQIEASESETTPDLDEWMDQILPTVTLPKYLTDKLSASSFNASQLEVLECSDQPVGTPYHPCRVRDRETNVTYFLKVVDNDQPNPTKREIDILHRIEEIELHKTMNVPRLEGLVTFDDVEPTKTGQKRIMGILLTEIPSPTPLTMKLDEKVPQEKRDAWAKEVDRIKDLLHKHEIVWGDAKADNFMVDKDDKLWIIDFGGSYTEGWVDAELNETEEGDDMGIEKIVSALEDPVANVQREDEGENKGREDHPRSARSEKRKREEEEDDDDNKHIRIDRDE